MAKVTIMAKRKNIPVELPTGILSMNTRSTEAPIILVTVDGRLRELHKRVKVTAR